jgi:hypothetical protein
MIVDILDETATRQLLVTNQKLHNSHWNRIFLTLFPSSSSPPPPSSSSSSHTSSSVGELGPLACGGLELTKKKTMNVNDNRQVSVGRGNSPRQGWCLHSTTQSEQTQTCYHMSGGIRTQNPRTKEDSSCPGLHGCLHRLHLVFILEMFLRFRPPT